MTGLKVPLCDTAELAESALESPRFSGHLTACATVARKDVSMPRRRPAYPEITTAHRPRVAARRAE